MKKIIVMVFLGLNFLYAEPAFYGAYYGNIKENMKTWNNYPNNRISYAGKVYLYKENIKSIDYIVTSKSEQIDAAIKEAKEYAKKNKFTKCAIDNIVHQVIMDENTITIMTDYNVIGFN